MNFKQFMHCQNDNSETDMPQLIQKESIALSALGSSFLLAHHTSDHADTK